jgi:cell division protein FtsI/penicillin-binding protein 2
LPWQTFQFKDVTNNDDPKQNLLGRRGFLKSLVGLRSDKKEEGTWQKPFPETFIWANLKTGQVGFPTGFANIDVLPGSIMHLVTAACLCQNGCGEEKQICTGEFEDNENTFTCVASHGELDLVSALARGCSVFFAKAASKLSITDLLNSAEKLGLNQKVGDFQAGVFPISKSPDAKRVSLFATGLSPLLRPTPLQHLRLASYIATNGNLPKLHSAEKPVSGLEPVPEDMTELTWQTLQAGMLASAREGTCQNLDPDNTMNLCAIGSTVKHNQAYASWLITYFPSEAPRYAFLALNESQTPTGDAFRLAQIYMTANWL